MEKRSKINKIVYQDEVVLINHVNTRYFFCSIERLKHVFNYALNLEEILYYGFNLNIFELTLEEIYEKCYVKRKDREGLYSFLLMMKSFDYIKEVSYVEITEDLRLWIILNKNYPSEMKKDIGKRITLNILELYDFFQKSPTGTRDDQDLCFYRQRIASNIPPKK